MDPTSTTTAGVAILAGGLGSRMGADGNKVFLEIDGKPLLAYSLETADRCHTVGLIVLVVRSGEEAQAEQLAKTVVQQTPVRLVAGGPSRHISERHGVEAMSTEISNGHLGVVAVHDGARPFLSAQLLDRVLSQADEVGGAIPALPASESELLYRIDEQRFIDSQTVYWAQTAQAFRALTVLEAHRAAAAAGFEGTDTVEVVERFSDCRIAVAPGEPANLKVTFPDDLHGLRSSEDDRRDDQPATTPWPRAEDLKQELQAADHDDPLIIGQADQETASGLIKRLQQSGADVVVCARAATQAIKLVDDGFIRESIDRTQVFTVEAPLAIRRLTLAAALDNGFLAPDQSSRPLRFFARADRALEIYQR